MPIYEYHCEHCNRDFEFSQKITDAPLSACPTCDGPVAKLISHSSFVLKGGGWYKTDYAAKSGSAKAPACSDSGSKASCKGCPSAAD